MNFGFHFLGLTEAYSVVFWVEVFQFLVIRLFKFFGLGVSLDVFEDLIFFCLCL
jgi:hypothetical protein